MKIIVSVWFACAHALSRFTLHAHTLLKTCYAGYSDCKVNIKENIICLLELISFYKWPHFWASYYKRAKRGFSMARNCPKIRGVIHDRASQRVTCDLPFGFT